jgi:hypothetical protein
MLAPAKSKENTNRRMIEFMLAALALSANLLE